MPSLIVRAGGAAEKRFLEFFAAQIRNRNTREAYLRAVPTHEDRPERRHAVHRRIASVGPALAAQRMESAAVSQAKKAPKWVLEESRTIG
jgi:hypothetical protein